MGMVADMRKAGSEDGATAWISFKEGEWQCQHKSYNGKFYYDYAHWDPKTDKDEGCGVVMIADFTTTKDSGSKKETDNHWHTKPCDSKRECVCQGSRKPEWAPRRKPTTTGTRSRATPSASASARAPASPSGLQEGNRQPLAHEAVRLQARVRLPGLPQARVGL